MPKQDTKLESEGAEFLVLGQLLIEGIPAYKTYTNLRGYDLVAVWPESNHSARIQVKSRWATDANAHLIKNFDSDFVVLARLNRGYKYSGIAKKSLGKSNLEFYVLPSSVAKERVHEKGWSKILWKPSEFEEFRENWSHIREFLQTGI